MNGKTAKMLRKMEADNSESKKLWQQLRPTQRERVRTTFKQEGPKQAVVVFAEEATNGK